MLIVPKHQQVIFNGNTTNSFKKTKHKLCLITSIAIDNSLGCCDLSRLKRTSFCSIYYANSCQTQDSSPETSFLHYLFYSSTKWLHNPMCSKLCIFIRQSLPLPPKVYNPVYETYIKKSQRTEKKAKRQEDTWWGVSVLVVLFFFLVVVGFFSVDLLDF